MTPLPRICGLATAVPSHLVDQADARAAARRVFAGRLDDLERFADVFLNAGIARRHATMPLDWHTVPHGWAERNALYLDTALDLLERSAVAALARAGLGAAVVDTLVVVSTTGIATPSLDARLMERLPFRRDVQRLPIFGLGCAGGVLGLARAAALARAQPGSNVLFLVVELCTLTFRHDDASPTNIVATALFADGAAAALLRADDDTDGPAVTAWGEHTWPGSLEIMGWRVEETGLGVVFAPSIPTLVRERLGEALDAFLARQGLERAEIAGYICHPGGAKVIAALEAALALPAESLDAARAVLRDHGNMSAATVLFVLDRHLAAGDRGRHLMTALGPGFTAAFLLLDL